MRSVAFRRACFTLGATVAVVLTGCGGSGNSGPGAANVVKVSERDFRISAPRRVEAGDVLLSVRNQGPDAHELIVIRADEALPLRADGTTVDEDALEPSTVGVLEPGNPNTDRLLSVHLSPGHYVLICNMAGHYLGGMNTELIVDQ
jgi:uncharacterized cupredoxin-like copper-binding protein